MPQKEGSSSARISSRLVFSGQDRRPTTVPRRLSGLPRDHYKVARRSSPTKTLALWPTANSQTLVTTQYHRYCPLSHRSRRAHSPVRLVPESKSGSYLGHVIQIDVDIFRAVVKHTMNPNLHVLIAKISIRRSRGNAPHTLGAKAWSIKSRMSCDGFSEITTTIRCGWSTRQIKRPNIRRRSATEKSAPCPVVQNPLTW